MARGDGDALALEWASMGPYTACFTACTDFSMQRLCPLAAPHKTQLHLLGNVQVS